MPKTVPLSVRVSADDAEFIARVQVSGATTPSDKVRALLGEARRRHEGVQDYRSCLGVVREMLAPALQRVREAEHAERVHSALVAEVGEWLPDACALLLAAGATPHAPQGQQLRELEDELADRVFRLLETVLRMGVTSACRGYDPEVVSRRLAPVLELAELIRSNREA